MLIFQIGLYCDLDFPMIIIIKNMEFITSCLMALEGERYRHSPGKNNKISSNVFLMYVLEISLTFPLTFQLMKVTHTFSLTDVNVWH